MRVISNKPAAFALLAMLAVPMSASLSAQEQMSTDPNIVVTGEPLPDMSAMTPGPEIKGVITARKGDRMKITAADGTSTVVAINETTKLKASSGLFGSKGQKPSLNALLNGLPVTVKTMQAGQVLLASQVSYKSNDFKTAMMIRNGTEQQFAEQTAATQALRGRMADIDNYNIKGTTNVFFDTGKWQLSQQAKMELCNAASQAESTSNALLLVVGYTDSVGSEEYNQTLSEKRASSVINYLQQACRWKPYRVLTPTGMAEADPLADNTTEEGKAQNRRVAVNILVSKSVEGL
ncbi:MAG: OmpA family protein [Sphingomonadaceae bacterium]|jgi:outer membrane protein OmpA-like peptidoglycan-associated protein|nr:OmpA family protein [Sphingomonadaceae bacterium]